MGAFHLLAATVLGAGAGSAALALPVPKAATLEKHAG